MSIAAVLVNHNTSAFAELAIRSLFVQHPGLNLTLTVYDNGSTDDRDGMLTAANVYGAQVVQSGFGVAMAGNSHGEVLRRFVLDPGNQDADAFLFLDADVCFTRPRTITALLDTLSAHADAFGAGPRMSWDGETPLPATVSDNPGLCRVLPRRVERAAATKGTAPRQVADADAQERVKFRHDR